MSAQPSRPMGRALYEFAWGRLVHSLRCRHPFVSQGELSRQIGITQSTLSRIERGDVAPDLFVARSIARGLGLHLDVLDRNIEEAWSMVPPLESEGMEKATLAFAIAEVVRKRWAPLSDSGRTRVEALLPPNPRRRDDGPEVE